MNGTMELVESSAPGPSEPQRRLFFLPEDLETERERKGMYTGERLERDRPDMYRMIVEMITQRQSVRAIKRLCRVHHSTIAAVAERARVAIDTGRERVCEELALARLMLAESIVEAVAEGLLKPEALGVTLGIVAEKLELLSGNATIRVETTVVDGPKTLGEWIRERRKTGCGVVENAQMRAAKVHRLGVGGEFDSLELREREAVGVSEGGEGGVAETGAGLGGPTH